MTAEQFVVWISGYLELSTTISNRECIIKSALDKLNPLEFCYFLNGFFECSNETMTKAEFAMQDHLALVFNKVTTDIKVSNMSAPNFLKINLDMNTYKNGDEFLIGTYPYTPNSIC